MPLTDASRAPSAPTPPRPASSHPTSARDRLVRALGLVGVLACLPFASAAAQEPAATPPAPPETRAADTAAPEARSADRATTEAPATGSEAEAAPTPAEESPRARRVQGPEFHIYASGPRAFYLLPRTRPIGEAPPLTRRFVHQVARSVERAPF